MVGSYGRHLLGVIIIIGLFKNMSKSWQFLLILALLTVGVYTGFEIYNSIGGGNTQFDREVEPIPADLGQDVLDHIETTINELDYKGEQEILNDLGGDI